MWGSRWLPGGHRAGARPEAPRTWPTPRLALLRLGSLGNRGRGAAGGEGLPPFPDPGLLPASLPEVVELGAPNPAVGQHVDLADGRRMDGERPLHPDPEGDLSNGEGLPKAAALPADHHALEHLDPLPAGFRDAHVHTNGIARREVGQVISQAWLFDEVESVHTRLPMRSGERPLMIAPAGRTPGLRQPLAQFSRGPDRHHRPRCSAGRGGSGASCPRPPPAATVRSE